MERGKLDLSLYKGIFLFLVGGEQLEINEK